MSNCEDLNNNEPIVTGIEDEINGVTHESVLADVAAQDNEDVVSGDNSCHRGATADMGHPEKGIGIFKDLVDSFKEDKEEK